MCAVEFAFHNNLEFSWDVEYDIDLPVINNDNLCTSFCLFYSVTQDDVLYHYILSTLIQFCKKVHLRNQD